MCRSVLIAASLLLTAISMMSTIVAADSTRSFADIVEGDHNRQSYRFNDNPPVSTHNNWPVQHSGQGQIHGQPNPSHGTCSTNYGLNYLRFSIQWGPGYCATNHKRCQIVEPVFTIHGMWPQVSAEKNLEHCCGDSEFDLRKVDDTLLGDMNKYWFSFFSRNSRGFWNHQWRKHGTCAREVAKLRGQKLYFETTIDKMISLDLQGTLYRDNIRPGPDRGFVYPSSDIVESLKKRTGGKGVRIDCDYQHDDRIPILTGISVCLDKNLAYIDCPFSGNKCRRQVYFRASAD